MAREENFVWPTPPYFSYASPEDGLLPQDCVITKADGTKRYGQLMRFLPEKSVLGFKEAQKKTVEGIEFSAIKTLILPNPTRLLPREIEKIQQAGGVLATGGQSVSIQFKDGE